MAAVRVIEQSHGTNLITNNNYGFLRMSVSQIANVTSFDEKIVSNSVRFIAKLSQIDLKLPCNSLILARLRLIS